MKIRVALLVFILLLSATPAQAQEATPTYTAEEIAEFESAFELFKFVYLSMFFAAGVILCMYWFIIPSDKDLGDV
jgi:hypothetical protein